MTDAELLPCPFCGTDERPHMVAFGGGIYYRACLDCAAAGPGRKSAEEGDAAWNRRAPDLAAHARGAAEERAAVVAWLREFGDERCHHSASFAEDIARGEHRREGGG
jgi:Lar family restriction alleviation protein